MPIDPLNVIVGRGADRGDRIERDDLVGEIIVFAVDSYDPAEKGQYGVQPRVDADLLVVTGRAGGRRDRRWRTWGELARQMAEQSGTTVARVITGHGKSGSRWFGLDFDITPGEASAVAEVVAAASGDPRLVVTPEPAAKPVKSPPATSADVPLPF